jgi:hypothetical protein
MEWSERELAKSCADKHWLTNILFRSIAPSQLAAQHGSEMYHHFLRRLVVAASPVVQSLSSQVSNLSQPAPPPGLGTGKTITGPAAITNPGDRPLKGPLSIPQTGAGALAWRLLESEARRACRDGSLGGCLVAISSVTADDGQTQCPANQSSSTLCGNPPRGDATIDVPTDQPQHPSTPSDLPLLILRPPPRFTAH